MSLISSPKYTERHEDRAIEDIVRTVPFGDDIKDILHEYEERKSVESLLAKDSDSLELLLALKEQSDIGNSKANTWMPSLVKRLKTKEAKELAKIILKTNSDDWWFQEKEGDWWINRNNKQ